MPRKRGLVAVLLVAALLSSTAAVGVVAGQSMVTLTVTVVDADGDPVSGIDLSATWEDGGPAEETTRANGKALVDVPEGANVTIRVDDDEYVRNSPYEIENATAGDVEVPVTRAGTAEVTVVDDDGPVADARVLLYGDGVFAVDSRTDENGVVTSGDVERGDYDVRVRKAGYLRNSTELTVDGEVSTEVEIAEATRSLTVDVGDDHFDPPRDVGDAEVSIDGVGTITTRSNGEASVAVPVNAEYDVSVTKAGYETNETSVEVDESDARANVTIQRTPAIDVESANRRVVVGEPVEVTVTDEYGDPVEGASVAIGDDEAGETDADGEIGVPVESAGEHTITATSGDLEASVDVEGVQPGGDAETETTAGDDTESPSGIGGPGFTPAVAVVAVLAVAFLLARR